MAPVALLDICPGLDALVAHAKLTVTGGLPCFSTDARTLYTIVQLESNVDFTQVSCPRAEMRQVDLAHPERTIKPMDNVYYVEPLADGTLAMWSTPGRPMRCNVTHQTMCRLAAFADGRLAGVRYHGGQVVLLPDRVLWSDSEAREIYAAGDTLVMTTVSSLPYHAWREGGGWVPLGAPGATEIKLDATGRLAAVAWGDRVAVMDTATGAESWVWNYGTVFYLSNLTLSSTGRLAMLKHKDGTAHVVVHSATEHREFADYNALAALCWARGRLWMLHRMNGDTKQLCSIKE